MCCCDIRIGGVNWTGDKSRVFSVVLNIFETEQLQIENWVEKRQNKDSFVLSELVVWNRHNLYWIP